MPYDSSVVVEQGAAVATVAVKAMSAAALLDPAAARRRERDERAGLDMLSNLERQAREILHIAGAATQQTDPQRFAACRAFRMRLGEFEAFCNVIESHLRKLAGDGRSELDVLF